MVFEGLISSETKAYARYLRHDQKMSLRQIARICNISHSSVSRVTSAPLPDKKTRGGCGQKVITGRPRKLSSRAERHLERELNNMQESVGTFHVPDLMASTGVSSSDVSQRSVRRSLNRKGYKFVQTRRKGVLTKNDLKIRTKFAKEMLKKYPAEFWKNDVAFYLDGVSFVYKTNPYDQARAPGSRMWRKPSQGLKRGCTSKGKKEGTGGRYVKLIVAISYGKGIVKCQPYDRMSGDFFAEFILANFEQMFEDAGKDSSTWIQDGDPSQNSKKAQEAMRQVRSHLLSIPPRSPDLNPIENIFHIASKQLTKAAIAKRIEREDLASFQERVIGVLYDIPIDTINRTIDSMNGRLKRIIGANGGRIKY